ncbi:MAG: FkbM family methyltransferase [Nanoarchaeota archaeon]
MSNKIIKLYKYGHEYLNKHNIRPLFIRKLNQFIIKKIKTNHVEIDGHKIYLDKPDSMRLSTRGYFESEITESFKNYVKEGDTVVDIGAHIGYHTLTLAKLVGEKGKVYAFEPCPEIFELLKKNINVNGYKNVILINKAVSNSADKHIFYVDKTGRNSLINSTSIKLTQSIEVDTIRLDDLNIKPNLIKMDIEGGEIKALRGMNDTIKKNQVVLITEYAPFYFEDPTELIRIIEEVGFKTIYNLFDNGKVELFDYNNINRYIPEGKNITSNTNLVCTK